MRFNAIHISIGVMVAGVLTACDEEPPTFVESIRPIRTVVVSEVASGQVRQFSGLIEASDSSGLSFQIGGNVREVLVSQGDEVTAGDVLATLDTEPFELDVQAAEANLAQVRSEVAQTRAEFDRQRELYQQGWVARARFDTAQRDFVSSTSRADYAVARLNLAQRDLRNTTLVAPFDGVISERSIDPFVEVQAGQVLFQIDAEGGMEAAFGIPETVIGQIVLGMPATVSLLQTAEPADALITEIGSTAGPGNTFPVYAALVDPDPGIRPGMTAEVSLVLTSEARESGYLVPLSAVAPGDSAEEGNVFVFDADTSTVRRTTVTLVQTSLGNRVAVKGLNAGDIIATAGVNFLVDGHKVALLDPAIAAASR